MTVIIIIPCENSTVIRPDTSGDHRWSLTANVIYFRFIAANDVYKTQASQEEIEELQETKAILFSRSLIDNHMFNTDFVQSFYTHRNTSTMPVREVNTSVPPTRCDRP
jgi:uncharacterized protein YecE (DUF72 family)